MKIAQIAPLMESVPPKMYGGTERIVSYLTEELVRLGHDVTLFASGDSKTRARLIPGSSRALRLADCCDPLPHHLLMLDDLRQYADDFDALHFHIDYLQYLMFPGRLDRCITTLHGRTDLADQQPFYRRFSDVSLVSISNDQRKPMPPANWAGTVYHGLPRDLLSYRPAPRDGYLAFLGRISPEKRPDLAIEIARRTGRRLKIAAKVDRVDRDYFNDRIKPLLNDPAVEFIGEVNEAEKDEFLGGATALLFPIDWPEPFGLVMIEAMACGTPVVAFRRGSVPEVIESGVTGLIVDDVAGAVQAVNLIENLDRRAVRRAFEERFSVERMAADYLAIYERLSYRGQVDEPATGTA